LEVKVEVRQSLTTTSESGLSLSVEVIVDGRSRWRRPPRRRRRRRSGTESFRRSEESFLLGIAITRNEFLGASFEETEYHTTTHEGLDHQGWEGEDAVESGLTA
jgi:hypothetical protein